MNKREIALMQASLQYVDGFIYDLDNGHLRWNEFDDSEGKAEARRNAVKLLDKMRSAIAEAVRS